MRVIALGLGLLLSSCAAGEVTHLTCYVLNDRSVPFRFTIDEASKTFSVKAGTLDETSGPAEFMSEQVHLTDSEGQQGWIINRSDLTWQQLNGPDLGQCEMADAPKVSF